MRAGPVIATVVVFALLPTHGRAQDSLVSAVHAADGVADSHAVHRTSPTVDVNDRLQQWMEKFRPLRDRFLQNDRLRTAESVVGFGIAAYEASRAQPRLPLGSIGTEALRLGLHHQLTFIRRRSGYVVEPSIGRRSLAVTFHKTLE